VFRFASRSNPVRAARPANRGGLAGAGRPNCGHQECTRLAKAALGLLHDGDVRGARDLLAKIVTPTRGPRRPWVAAWAERVRSRRLMQPPERSRAANQSADTSRAVPTSAATAALAGPAPIRINALGGFDLVIDGVAFASGAKPQRRPLDLLKVLLISNGSSIGAAELADRLWPDSDGDTARNALQVAVHRLRRLLGRDQAVVVQDRKVCLDHELCAVDLWTFERDAQHLLCTYPDAPWFPDKAAETLRLYRGHLFAHEADQAWMLAPRERLRRLWLGLVRRLGDHHELRGQCDRACELYQRAVDLDPLAEEVYRRLMRCQQSAGECAEAVHTYRRCREQLVTVLGVGPSAETERLYHTLRSAA
jgi:LuxR family transcriptional regulator, maltose regulon positive regulatory protein